jgi:hypothetical protein
VRYDRTFAGTRKRACDGRFFQLSIRPLRWPSWATYRSAVFSLPFRNPQHPAFFKNVAIVGGLLFYFASGPGS